MTVRIAMWSGPRNVSTALMRSFEARGDCAVVDEPLYAAFLTATGKHHPGRDEILASQPTDPAAALDALRPGHGLPLQYEKHMAHHWQPGWPFERFGDAVRHAFLVRDPARVIPSYARVREAPVPEDLGYDTQLALLERVVSGGAPAVVIDGDALRADPAGQLRRLCAALGVPYTDRMLAWPPGRRPTDGVWAPHWYAAVEASTGFAAPEPAPPPVPVALRPVLKAVRPAWERLRAYGQGIGARAGDAARR